MKIYLLTWFFLFLIQGAFCQLKFNNLNEVLTYADNNNISIKQGAVNIRVLDANTKTAKAAFKPTINGFGNAGYDPIIPSQVVPEKLFGGTEGKFTKVQFGLPFNVSAGVEASLPIINFEKWEAIRSSHLETDKARWSLEAVKENLHRQVTIQYYQALAWRDLLQVNKENERVLEQLITIMEQRNEKGIVNPVDLNRSKSLLLDNQLIQVEYTNKLDVTLNALYALLNAPEEEQLIFTDSLSVDWNFPLLPLVESTATSKESVAAYQLALQQAKETSKAFLPNVAFTSKYYHSLLWSSGPTNQSIHFNAASLGIRLQVPIYSGGNLKAKQEKAALNVERAELEIARISSMERKEQNDRLAAFTQAQKKWNLVQQRLLVTKENLRIAQLSMQEGIMEFEVFSNIFSEYTKALTENLQTRVDGILYKILLTQ